MTLRMSKQKEIKGKKRRYIHLSQSTKPVNRVMDSTELN